jgi:hypothetical protein
MEPIVHKVRANAFEGEAIWRLGADALEREEAGKGPRTLPYASISELRLSYAPSRIDSARYRCDVTMKDGAAEVILSTHYAGIGDFESRAATYVPFVRALVARVAAANPAVQLRSGKRPLAYILEHAVLLAMLLLLALVLELVGGVGLTGMVLIKLMIVACYVPIAFLYMRKNWPRHFAANAVPQDVLPTP